MSFMLNLALEKCTSLRFALDKPRALQFLIQKMSVVIQRGNQLGTLNQTNFDNGFL